MRLWKDIRILFSLRDITRFGAILFCLLVNSCMEIFALATIPFFITVLLNRCDLSLLEGKCSKCLASLCSFLHVDSMTGILLVVCGAFLFIHVARYLLTYWGSYVQCRILANRRIELSNRILTDYAEAYHKIGSQCNRGELATRAVVDSEQIINQVISPILGIFHHGFLLVCVIGTLLCVVPMMTVIAVAVIVVLGGGYAWLRHRYMRQIGEKERSNRLAATVYAEDAMLLADESKIYGIRDFFLGRFHGAIESVSICRQQAELQYRIVWPYMELVVLFALMMVSLVSLHKNGLNISALAPGLALLGVGLVRLRTGGINIMTCFAQMDFNCSALHGICKDIRKIEKEGRQMSASDNEPSSVPFNELAEFSELFFTYPDCEVPALSNVSLQVHKGDIIGIVGRSGCGKSTLLKMITGILPWDSGDFRIDGHVVQDIRSWQRKIGYVPQQCNLVKGSILSNIALGVPSEKIDLALLGRVIEQAGLKEFVEKNEKDGQGEVGEDGSGISGGEKQRIGIARALYRRPEVLVFDEATSALDNMTESEVIQAILHDNAGEQTIIMVAHRLETIRHCNQLLFMVNGEIAARGKFEELYENCPDFRQLADSAACEIVE